MAEDYTLRSTCKCYYKFADPNNLGSDNQGQINLTNYGATQSSDIPSGTYANPSAQNSADFEASESNRMYASHAESAEIDNIGALTILLWYKRESFDTSHYMVSKQTAIGDGFLLAHEKDGSNNYFMGYIENGTHDVLRTINADKWYFLALTYNGQWLRLYEGDEETQVVQVAQKNIGSKTIDTDGDFYIGRYAVGSNYVDGKVCELAGLSEALALSDLQSIQQNGIEGTVGEEHSGSASVSGGGSLDSSVKKGGKGTSSFSGGGILAVIAMVGMLGVAAISGNGSLQATCQKKAFGTAGISGGGSLVATGTKQEGETHYGTAIISGGGTTVSDGIKQAEVDATVSGVGSVGAEGVKEAQVDSVISGNGAVSSAGLKSAYSEIDISGGGTLTASGAKQEGENYYGTVAIQGGGSINSEGEKEAIGYMVLSGGGNITASAETPYTLTQAEADIAQLKSWVIAGIFK